MSQLCTQVDGPIHIIDKLHWYEGMFIALVTAGLTICVVAVFFVPHLKQNIIDELLDQRTIQQSQIQICSTPVDDDNYRRECDQISAASQTEPKELYVDPSIIAREFTQKPPVAYKPPHLMRQIAQDMQALEEVDLAVVPMQNNSPVPQPEDLIIRDTTSVERLLAVERYKMARLFSSLHLISACFGIFAHGSNDASALVAPLRTVLDDYSLSSPKTYLQLPVWSALSVCMGTWFWSWSWEMEQTPDCLNHAKGFAVELGSAITVLAAAKLGMPISSVHCKSSSKSVVELASSKYLFQYTLIDAAQQKRTQSNDIRRLLANILWDLLLTLPISAMISFLLTRALVLLNRGHVD